jgi:glycosyltransferase involved in cell wall biosynthesis
MKSEDPLVSFVTPFYNTERYLGECIESVLRQTYGNWEYVLLDNCSTDESAQIAERYRSQFPLRKIRLEHNPVFLSQVQNYNRALRLISPHSEYCKLVQADDWLFPDCVTSMVEVAEAHPTVGVVAAYELEGDEVRLSGLPYPSPEVPGRQVCRLYFFQGRYLFGTPTSLLFRSELIRSRDPFFDECYAPFEDGHACFDLLKTWNFGFVHQVLTYSRRDNQSIISRVRPFGLELFLHLSMLVAHGRDYLCAEEYDQCLKNAERQYFLYLGKCGCKLERMSPEFWDFHRLGLASVNYHLDWRLLGKWLPRAVIEKIWEAFWGRWDKGFRVTPDPECKAQEDGAISEELAKVIAEKQCQVDTDTELPEQTKRDQIQSGGQVIK